MRQRRLGGVDEMVISLVARGMGTGDVQALVGAEVVVDGLVASPAPEVLVPEARRLRVVALAAGGPVVSVYLPGVDREPTSRIRLLTSIMVVPHPTSDSASMAPSWSWMIR